MVNKPLIRPYFLGGVARIPLKKRSPRRPGHLNLPPFPVIHRTQRTRDRENPNILRILVEYNRCLVGGLLLAR